MAFCKNIKYGSVTLDFITACAEVMGLDVKEEKSLRIVLHKIGFQVSVFNEETGKYTPCRIDKMSGVYVRCPNKPYVCRKTTVFSGRLREEKDFPAVSVYDAVDILDLESPEGTDFVNSMGFDIPSVEKVNTRKYTKKEDQSDVIVMDLPEIDDMDDILNMIRGS